MAGEVLVSECIIAFDKNEHGTYFAGELVSGKVIISSSKPRILTAIKLELCGLARCAWKRKFGRNEPTYNTTAPMKNVHIGSEDYFHWTTYLIGHKYGPNITIPASTVSYNFAFQLPHNCPVSFEGKYGFVRYMVKISFLRSGAFDRTRMVGLTILPLLDLNRESPLLREPITNDIIQNTCFFRNDALSLIVSLSRRAYAIGELIPVTVHIRNNSKMDCKKIIIKLNLCAIYTSNQWQSITEYITLVERDCSSVRAQQHKTFLEPLRIPAAPPTSEHLSKVVRISYEIYVEAKMSGAIFMNVFTRTPITIGNVPYHESERSAEESLLVTSNTIISDNEETSSSVASDLSETGSAALHQEEAESSSNPPEMPPSYEEAMFMRADLAEEVTNEVIRSTIFVPRYPVYAVNKVLPIAIMEKTTKKKRRRRKQIKFKEEPFNERLV